MTGLMDVSKRKTIKTRNIFKMFLNLFRDPVHVSVDWDHGGIIRILDDCGTPAESLGTLEEYLCHEKPIQALKMDLNSRNLNLLNMSMEDLAHTVIFFLTHLEDSDTFQGLIEKDWNKLTGNGSKQKFLEEVFYHHNKGKISKQLIFKMTPILLKYYSKVMNCKHVLNLINIYYHESLLSKLLVKLNELELIHVVMAESMLEFFLKKIAENKVNDNFVLLFKFYLENKELNNEELNMFDSFVKEFNKGNSSTKIHEHILADAWSYYYGRMIWQIIKICFRIIIRR